MFSLMDLWDVDFFRTMVMFGWGFCTLVISFSRSNGVVFTAALSDLKTELATSTRKQSLDIKITNKIWITCKLSKSLLRVSTKGWKEGSAVKRDDSTTSGSMLSSQHSHCG